MNMEQATFTSAKVLVDYGIYSISGGCGVKAAPPLYNTGSNAFTDNGKSKPFEKCIDASNDVGVEHLANNIGVEHLPNNEMSIPNCALELNDLSTPSCVKDIRVSLFVEACESLGSKQCNLPGAHYHCSLCPPGKQFPSLYRINCHIEQAHVKPARCLDFGKVRILPCKKEHDDIKYSKCNYHYHCPICNKTIMHKNRFEHHIALHMRKMDLTKSTSRPAGSDTSGGTLGNTELKSNAEAFNDKEPMPTESNSMTITDIDEAADIKEMCESVPTASNLNLNRAVNPVVTCHHCGKSMLKKNLRRHSVTAHNYITFTAVCCDQELGLYMVCRNQQGGIGFPVHVQKILHSSEVTSVDCGDLDCKMEMQVAGRAKMTGRECVHLLKVNNAQYPETVKLLDSKSLELGQDNKFKILKNETIRKCMEMNSLAIEKNASTVVQWQDGNYAHMSIFDCNVQNRPVHMRCILSFNSKNGQLKRQCGQQNYFCMHKAIGLWFLHQTNQLTTPTNGDNDNEADIYSADEDSPCKPVKSLIVGNFVYPPQDDKGLMKMCNYMKNNKQIPVHIPQYLRSIANESIPKAFIPIKNRCHECNENLKGPFLLSGNATILTMKGLLQGYSTFTKSCRSCHICYRYQEYTDGVHNFNDKFLMTLDICVFMRKTLKQHVAVGTICVTLEQYLHIKLKHQTVVDAYMHFIALSEHQYNFNCVICGFHPPRSGC